MEISELETMQRLHQFSMDGAALSDKERAALRSWYEAMDRDEDRILNKALEIPDSDDLRENLAQTTEQIALVNQEIKSIISQNTTLRSENHSLRQALESRLMEKVA